MKDWRKAVVSPECTIRAAIERMDASAVQVALVVDGGHRLLGVVTDGDVRRAVLRGTDLGAPVAGVMCRTPVTARPETSHEDLLALMLKKSLRQVPLVDRDGLLLGLKRLETLLRIVHRDNLVVLMAGGRGQRLAPLTADCPKPMLRVGSRPILETILAHFVRYGFRRFVIAVGYLGHVVRDHFGDGSRFDAEIRYVTEESPLGTAGALSLLPEAPGKPFFVMNGDLLTTVNVLSLLDYHLDHRSEATMCVREYDLTVPYGVVETDGTGILSIAEKPVQRFLVNAGIYVLEPSCLRFVARGAPASMNEVFAAVVREGGRTAAFPLREYWLDVGRPPDLERARQDYPEVMP